MSEREKMICVDCGVEMNLHAEKVDYPGEPAAADDGDLGLGGRLEEFHTCPSCGRTDARPSG
jgi:predicted RNA-binding Zn-ribbon protein involved in translation (DUF1610 family)